MDEMFGLRLGLVGGLIFFDLIVPMRLLMIGLLVSVGVLLVVAGAGARHIWRQRRRVSRDVEPDGKTRKGDE